MSNFSRALAFAAALCSLPALGADIDALLRAKWVQAETRHFRVVTDHNVDTARLLATDLERMRYFSLRALGIDAIDGIAPLTILAIDNPNLFVKLGLPETYSGVFSTSLHSYSAIANVNGYVGDSDTPTEARSVLLHEYHHFLVRMTLRTVAYPMWCDEGMAEYFSSFRYDNAAVTVGDIDDHNNRVDGLFGPGGRLSIDSARLFNTTALDYASTAGTNTRTLRAFYARAGFAIHYFNSSPELRAQLADYLRLYNLGIGQDRAARLAFKRDYAQLDNDIATYLLKRLSVRIFKATDGPFKFPPLDIKLAALDRPRVAAVLATVLTRVELPRASEDAVVARNLQENPDSAQAHTIRLRQARDGHSGADVRALNQRFPGNAPLLSMLAETMLEQAEALRASGLPGWQTQLLEARDQFRRADKADATYPATYYGLGRVYLSLPDSEPPDEGIVAFDNASIYEPTPEIFRGLATLALRAKRPEQALAALRHAVTFTMPSDYSEDALMLDNLELLNDLSKATSQPRRTTKPDCSQWSIASDKVASQCLSASATARSFGIINITTIHFVPVTFFGYTTLAHGDVVKQREFVRWLTKQGATFEDGTKHLKVYLNGEMSLLPRHPSKELKMPLVEGVKKQLKLK